MASLAGVEIPEDIEWTDEFNFSPAAHALDVSLGGSLIIDTGELQAGRPITLSGNPNRSWVTRATVEALKALADQPGLEMALTIRGETQPRTVIFRHHEAPAFEAYPIQSFGDPISTDWYYCILKLMEV